MDIVIMLLTFAICFISYRQGLRDGLRLKANKSIEPTIKNPATVYNDVKKAKETTKEVETLYQGIENLLNYDGTIQKEVTK